MDLTLTGFHHLTAVSADAPYNHKFYTDTLGMRLVKKTVNQDDTSAYHLFYADGEGNPGTDITFFDWPVGKERRGNHTVSRTGLRVRDEAALGFWQERLKSLGVSHGEIVLRDNRPTLDLEDREGQRLSLVADGGQGPGVPWGKSPVPADMQVRGLGPITMSVPDLKGTDAVLKLLLNMREVRSFTDADQVTTHVYEMGEGGPAAELHVRVDPKAGPARPGAGGVHHVAFRVPTFEDYELWNARLKELGVPSSGPVDRYYFRSLYFREPNGVLFELATDAPGFSADEPQATLGERLSLPPFLEGQRAAIEAGLKPL
ncbi:ring-cleaving dioxygenase [Azorhizobium oxalatiphilum]|uniref:ring-cleaving dioxygenase n=1 Tax=Azorhizobium oxalatiphilum TaxID=980631 RepID=UPI001AEDBC99|nr:ring-cleaving dioxygenase [Azorhizobium oxalatiphilum]